MPRSLAALLLFALCVPHAPLAIGADPGVQHVANSTDTTLRLYFAPAESNARRGPSDFVPNVAKLFVDNHYVGDAIVNLHGHLPTLKFGAGEHKIRVEMSGGKSFESKIIFLGHGSTQILFVDFEKASASPNKDATEGRN